MSVYLALHGWVLLVIIFINYFIVYLDFSVKTWKYLLCWFFGFFLLGVPFFITFFRIGSFFTLDLFRWTTSWRLFLKIVLLVIRIRKLVLIWASFLHGPQNLLLFLIKSILYFHFDRLLSRSRLFPHIWLLFFLNLAFRFPIFVVLEFFWIFTRIFRFWLFKPPPYLFNFLGMLLRLDLICALFPHNINLL